MNNLSRKWGDTFFVSTAEIIIDGFLFSAAWNDIVVEFAPPAVTFGIDKYNVVPTVVISAVHKDGMQSIGGGHRFWPLDVRVQIQFLVEFKSAIQQTNSLIFS